MESSEIHICYITPAGCVCTCGWTKTVANSHLAYSHGYGHVSAYLTRTTTKLIDLVTPAKEFFRAENAKDGVDR